MQKDRKFLPLKNGKIFLFSDKYFFLEKEGEGGREEEREREK